MTACDAMVETELRAERDAPAETLDVDELIGRVSAAKGVSAADVRGASRIYQVTLARHICCWALRHQPAPLTLQAIGEIMDGRDHSTIWYAVDRIDRMLAASERARSDMTELVPTMREVAESRRERGWREA